MNIVFDGERLSTDPDAEGRRLLIDDRCLRGEPVARAYAHVCALVDGEAKMRFDEPEVQQAARRAGALDPSAGR